jgi:hypothetical protein
MIYTIFIYTKLFTKRNGLIKNNILEAQNYSLYLRGNADKIILGYEFKNQQPFIYALGETKFYIDREEIKESNKLGIAYKIEKLLS